MDISAKSEGVNPLQKVIGHLQGALPRVVTMNLVRPIPSFTT
jgi:hypothetical protein